MQGPSDTQVCYFKATLRPEFPSCLFIQKYFNTHIASFLKCFEGQNNIPFLAKVLNEHMIHVTGQVSEAFLVSDQLTIKICFKSINKQFQ